MVTFILSRATALDFNAVKCNYDKSHAIFKETTIAKRSGSTLRGGAHYFTKLKRKKKHNLCVL